PAERIFFVHSERRDPRESQALVQAAGFALVDASLQPQQRDILSSRILFKMLRHQLPEPQTTKLRAHVHPLDLSILGAKKFDPATSGRHPVIAQQKKRHTLRD